MSSQLQYIQALLPESIHEVAEVIGLPETLKLVDRMGGTTFCVPRGKTSIGRATLKRLETKLGSDVAQKLALHFEGQPFYIPRCEVALRRLRDIDICNTFERRIREGETANRAVADLATYYKLSDRRVWIILKNTPPEGEFETEDLFH